MMGFVLILGSFVVIGENLVLLNIGVYSMIRIVIIGVGCIGYVYV